MDTDQYALANFIAKSHAVFQIIPLLLRNGLSAFSMQRDICAAREDHLPPQQMGELLHLEGNGQIDAGLCSPVRSHRSPILSAMTGINDQGGALFRQYNIFGHVHCIAMP